MKTYAVSTIKRTKQDKLAAVISKFALAIAKQKSKSEYLKYLALRKKYITLKTALIRRYAGPATQAVRKYMAQQK